VCAAVGSGHADEAIAITRGLTRREVDSDGDRLGVGTSSYNAFGGTPTGKGAAPVHSRDTVRRTDCSSGRNTIQDTSPHATRHHLFRTKDPTMMTTPISTLRRSAYGTAAVACLSVLGYFTQVVHTAALRGELSRSHQRVTGEYLQPAAIGQRAVTLHHNSSDAYPRTVTDPAFAAMALVHWR
jgi:hypothetical protein